MSPLTIESTFHLNSGYKMPKLGFGVYQTPAAEAESVVSHALNVGYRHIDSALVYRNEAPCGAAIKNSGLKREEIFFTSKIMSRKPTNAESAKALVAQTLANSGLDYLDLLLIHAPYGGPETRKTLWRALVEAQEAGQVRSLGVSNYGVHHLDELETHIKELEQERGPGKGGVVSVGQWEIHPWLPRHDIVAWCAARSIVVQAYCPVVRAKKMDDPLLLPLVEKYKKTPAQVLLRWSLQMGLCPLPKSVTFSRIEENRDLYDFELEEEEVRVLDTGAYEPCAWDPTVEPLEK